MKRSKLLSVCLILLLVLLLVPGCTQKPTGDKQSPDATFEPPDDPNVTYADVDAVSVTTENGSITPPAFFSWAESYDESFDSWESADGASPVDQLQSMLQNGELSTLPRLPNGQALTVTLPRDATLSRYGCYGLNKAGTLDQVIGHTAQTQPFFEQLNTLEDGEYYVAIHYSTRGNYIESEGEYESKGEYALFRYVIE
jgi:hypothetical protein